VHEITTVIPAFRCARYLGSAIQSVLLCTQGPIVVAEDGSGDDTLAVARSWQSRYPDRITVLANAVNAGTSATVNRAVQYVTSPFILKLDGDDVLLPGLTDEFAHLMSRDSQVAIVSPSAIRISSDDFMEPSLPMLTQLSCSDGSISILSGIDACRFILRWNPNPCSSGALYRREAFLACGGFLEGLSWGEDWEIWFRLARRYKVAYDSRPGALYRQHTTSTTALETQENRLCFSYERIYREGARHWPEDEMKPLFRRA